ncbi:hypothetical protein AA0243_0136 [Novacetimonas hansenii NRIC 0243]|nr:hypothetical protein AA0243_0136 [Novacetimonas hansenii NRIC 0243]
MVEGEGDTGTDSGTVEGMKNPMPDQNEMSCHSMAEYAKISSCYAHKCEEWRNIVS